MSLRSGLRSLTQLERRYSRNGLNNGERQELQSRLRSLRQEVRQADNGARGRYDDWDREGSRDDDRYDDRDGDRDMDAYMMAIRLEEEARIGKSGALAAQLSRLGAIGR